MDDLVERLLSDAEIYNSDEMSGVCARMKKAAARIAELDKERQHFRLGWLGAVDELKAAEARADRLAAILKEAESVVRRLLPLARNDRYVIQDPRYEDAEALLARLEAREVEG
jgi:hypothetical protein